MSMWIWTCSVCGEKFTGWTKRESEGKFIDHARSEHNPKMIVSTAPDREIRHKGGTDADR